MVYELVRQMLSRSPACWRLSQAPRGELSRCGAPLSPRDAEVLTMTFRTSHSSMRRPPVIGIEAQKDDGKLSADQEEFERLGIEFTAWRVASTIYCDTNDERFYS